MMSLTAAASGFVVFLLSVSVVQGQNGWGVTYTSTEICALKGSTVDINCIYTYPSTINGLDTTVEKSFWFTKLQDEEPVDLTTDSEYSARVQYICDENACTLRITDLRESDSAEYKFRFITNQPGGSYTGSPGVTLSVTDPGLQVQVSRLTVYKISTRAELKCLNICPLPDRPSYIWYKNGQTIEKATSSSYSRYFDPADSYSCAVKGLEDFPSPSVCVRDETCNRVRYADRSICAFKGSSVDISCTYNSHGYITSKFWFSPERSHQWQNPSQPQDLSKDSQYAGRVQVLDTERGRSTLRITDLRESDSAQYHFKFKTRSFEWRSSLPGTTLTVTAFQVQVSRTVTWPFTELLCHSSCRLPDRSSYIWFRNGKEIPRVETSSYKGGVSLGDNISCAVKGHEGFPSPSVYAPKLPSVSVSPSAEIVEGSSVTLTCSSDANPAANYTWYKENEDSPKASGQNFTITDLRAEHSGNYSCEAQNRRGRHNNSLHLTVVAGSMKSVAAGSITAIFLAIIFLCAFLLIRRKRSLKQTTEPGERPGNKAQLNMGSVYDNPSAAEEPDDLCYASVSFSKNQEDPLYSNIRPAQPNRHNNEEEEEEVEDGVEYTVVNFKSASAFPELRRHEAVEDSSALYSTVAKQPRV